MKLSQYLVPEVTLVEDMEILFHPAITGVPVLTALSSEPGEPELSE
jgi:hypothetical protein